MLRNRALGNYLQYFSGEYFIQSLVPGLITLIIVIGFVVFIFMFLISAVNWISSGGDKTSTAAARERLTQAIIGLVILLSAYAIFNLVETIFGVNLLSINFSSFFSP